MTGNGYPYYPPISSNIIMPPYLVCGDQWVFQMAAGDYDGMAGWMTFTAPGMGNKISTDGVQDGNVFTFTFESGVTVDLTAQPYVWTVTFYDADGQRYTAQSGATSVKVDISQTVPCTNMTSLQTMLAAVEKSLISVLGNKVQSVAYAGQTYNLHNIKDLWAIWTDLNNRVIQEQLTLSGNSRARRIIPRFVFR
jgi:hypothetical protein